MPNSSSHHRSGSARRRKRRLAALTAQLNDLSRAVGDGGDCISTANSALRGVMVLVAGCVNGMDITADELASLLGLISDEIDAGLDLQRVA